MDEPVAVREVMDRSYVGVSEGDSIVGAAKLMHQEGVDCAVVLRGTEPSGLLDATDVVGLVASGDDPEETTVGEVMSEADLTMDADARLADAVDAIAGNGPSRVVVTEDGGVAGVLAERDVIAAHTIHPAENGLDEGVTSPVATVGSEVYGSQGVCEACGSLTRDLTDHNGQLVCDDCLEM